MAHMVVKSQESQGDVAKQQGGGGQGKHAVDLALMDEVFTMILHLERRNGVTCNFDTASCFD